MDYRYNIYSAPYEDIVQQKTVFSLNCNLIGRYTNIYNLLHNKKSARDEFDNIYHSRCVYCGVNFSALDYPLFEIDHFIPTNPKDNTIHNLVLSCHKCNRLKSDFFFKEMIGLCHPDTGKLFEIFTRSDDFTIQVSERFKVNTIVAEFYNKLELGSFLRQLDYLISFIFDSLKNKKHSDDVIRSLSIVKDKLREKRNYFYKE